MPAVVSVEQRIEAILSETLEAAQERERNTLGLLLAGKGGRVVIVGAGSTGKRALACLRTIAVEPLAIADNEIELHGQVIDGITVLSPSDAARRYSDDALFIVAIWNAKHWYADTQKQLHDLGCTSVASISSVYWRFPETFLPFFVQDLPHKVLAECEEVRRAGRLWSDGQSRAEYLAHVRWRTHGDAGGLPPRPLQESYFADDIFDFSPDEVLVDCGAYDGDTIRSFLARCGDRFRCIEAIEPAPLTFDRLQRYASTLPPQQRRKIRLHPCAIGDKPGLVRFDATRGVDSQISTSGDVLVEVDTLDALCGASHPTYIKMDIEGAEYGALSGARELIAADRPILAICLEHYQHDLWRLPLLIHDIVPDYHLYLRTYEGDGWQSVAYAVPPERSRGNRKGQGQ